MVFWLLGCIMLPEMVFACFSPTPICGHIEFEKGTGRLFSRAGASWGYET
jgi:hypothetical protein